MFSQFYPDQSVCINHENNTQTYIIRSIYGKWVRMNYEWNKEKEQSCVRLQFSSVSFSWKIQNTWVCVPAACMCCSTVWHFEKFPSTLSNIKRIGQFKLKPIAKYYELVTHISENLLPFLYLQWIYKHVCWIVNVKFVLISTVIDRKQ